MLTPNHQPHALCTPHFPSRNLTTNHDNLPTNPPSSQNPHQYHQATHHYVHKNLLLGFNARKRFYTITSALAGLLPPMAASSQAPSTLLIFTSYDNTDKKQVYTTHADLESQTTSSSRWPGYSSWKKKGTWAMLGVVAVIVVGAVTLFWPRVR
ncbi:hypothetical protein PMIN01_03180 [Paraphaeosphaeria minitans]|uniref:Uncharacterized protein n=1 Tax=Paraphaeosphaeria minitans TaxID=565426 RepID=A0A9P6GLE3_9PLEO|nr:hypothetical protein PMIN01_03180 [Paraphaeosphaeria minitans]